MHQIYLNEIINDLNVYHYIKLLKLYICLKLFQKQNSLTGEIAVAVRLCVVVKRKVHLFYWKNQEFRKFGPDIKVSDVPRSVAWCRETLCLGFKGEYCLLKVIFSFSYWFTKFCLLHSIRFSMKIPCIVCMKNIILEAAYSQCGQCINHLIKY